uniref:Putative ras-related in brain n=2 Tax=Ixodes ricinus TaxID=34613 RepID=A0A131XR15_IXORI
MNTTTEVKLCLLGDSGVGKSSILQRFVYNTFNPSAESTIGASFMMKNMVLHDRTLKFNIWDTAGQERYRALAPMYYRGAAAAIIVYDITSQDSFAAVQSWVRELQAHGEHNIALGIAGNKCDLQDYREVSYATGESYAQQINAVFVETSALRATNIQELFMGIASKVPQVQALKPPELKLSLRGSTQKKCC